MLVYLLREFLGLSSLLVDLSVGFLVCALLISCRKIVL